MTVKLLTEHHLEFISLKGGCTGSSQWLKFLNQTDSIGAHKTSNDGGRKIFTILCSNFLLILTQ